MLMDVFTNAYNICLFSATCDCILFLSWHLHVHREGKNGNLSQMELPLCLLLERCRTVSVLEKMEI